MSQITEVLTDIVLKINSDAVLTTYKVKGITGFSAKTISEFIVKAKGHPKGAIYASYIRDVPDPDANNLLNGRVIQIKPEVVVFVAIKDRGQVADVTDAVLSDVKDLIVNAMYRPDNGLSANAGWDYDGSETIAFSQPAGITAIKIKFKRHSSFIYPNF